MRTRRLDTDRHRAAQRRRAMADVVKKEAGEPQSAGLRRRDPAAWSARRPPRPQRLQTTEIKEKKMEVHGECSVTSHGTVRVASNEQRPQRTRQQGSAGLSFSAARRLILDRPQCWRLEAIRPIKLKILAASWLRADEKECECLESDACGYENRDESNAKRSQLREVRRRCRL